MKYSKILILTFLIISCVNKKIDFEKEYYERISGIKFPEKYEVLESFDNGEFLTGTVFKIDSISLFNLIDKYHFDSLREDDQFSMMSNGYFENNKLILKPTKNIYIIRNGKDKVYWNYLIDLNNCRLWAEISYPDWGGN